MIGVFVVLASLLFPLIHLELSRLPGTRSRVIRLLLLYSFVLNVGVVGFLMGFIPHVFFADQAARLIGWQPGSPADGTFLRGQQKRQEPPDLLPKNWSRWYESL